MANSVIFVTGNENKFNEASKICAELGITVTIESIDVDEIQHHNPKEVALAKAKRAYEKVGRLVVVNDSFWNIPALGGFPGAYMKDVQQWFTPQDFLNLMRDKEDRTIMLTECVVYFDGSKPKLFTVEYAFSVATSQKGTSGSALEKVLVVENGQTLAELREAGAYSIAKDNSKHWHEFAQWYVTVA